MFDPKASYVEVPAHDPNTLRRLTKKLKRISLIRKRARQSRANSVTRTDRLPVSLSVPAVAARASLSGVVTHPKQEALDFEDSPYWYAYSRPTGGGIPAKKAKRV